MIKVSIIVPCYNGECYIERCINNLLKQTMPDFEIIIINDGSTDASEEILNVIRLRDQRIKIVHKENGGVSSARNVGLDIAKGEWITFVDIDDILKSNALCTLLELVEENCNIVFAGYERLREGKIINKIPLRRTFKCTSLSLARELFAPSDYDYQGNICSKLYRRSIINKNHIRFNESIKYNEDRLFTFTYLSYIKQGIYTTEPVYNYILHGKNAMAAIHGPNYWKFETDLDAFVEMNKIAQTYRSSEVVRLVRMGTIESYHWNLQLNAKYGNNDKVTNRRLKKKLLSVVPRGFLFKVYCNQKYVNIKIKLYQLAVKIGLR